ncbi:hypothetical protein V8G54_030337 [Vigna mungo]|uniref:Uncharacterized protein n=1 Tax=Vigna mungo TaxID=3915 RepID=A0AAQ3RL73_VIGMU
MNLSGLNSRASSQTLGSLPIDHKFTSNHVFSRISYPQTSIFSDDSLPIIGVVGCSLRVSFTMLRMYGRLTISDSPITLLLFPVTVSISSLAFSITLGFLINSASAHSIVIADVSVPAINMSCIHATSQIQHSIYYMINNPCKLCYSLRKVLIGFSSFAFGVGHRTQTFIIQ